MATKKTDAPASTAVDKPASTGVMSSAMREMALADSANKNTGFEEAGSEAYAIPFLQILQSGSPQVKRSEGAYIAGAAEGMFYNTVSQTLFPGQDEPAVGDKPAVTGGIVLIPCHYSQRFIEWKLRDEGGGFVGEHLPTDPIVQTTTKDDDNRDRLPNGNVLVDTRNHYVLMVLPDGSYEMAVISLSSTQLKKSRGWMSKMSTMKIKDGPKFIPAPMASHSYMAKTVAESNDKGAWMGWQFTLIGPVESIELYQAAQAFRNAILVGSAKSTTPISPEGGAAAESGTASSEM